MSGLLMVLEGTDGVGKTTQIELLKNRYKDFEYFRDPGTTLFGEKIRALLKESHKQIEIETQTLLFCAQRIEFMRKILLPKLENGINIIIDRFIMSNIFYQLGQFEASVPKYLYDAIDASRCGAIPHCIVLTVPYTFLIDNDRLKQEDLIEKDQNLIKTTAHSYEMAQTIFDRLITNGTISNANENIYMIDATQTIEEINVNIVERIDAILDKGKYAINNRTR